MAQRSRVINPFHVHTAHVRGRVIHSLYTHTRAHVCSSDAGCIIQCEYTSYITRYVACQMQSHPQNVNCDIYPHNARVEIFVKGVWSRGTVKHEKSALSPDGLPLIGVEQSDDDVYIEPPYTHKIRSISESIHINTTTHTSTTNTDTRETVDC